MTMFKRSCAGLVCLSFILCIAISVLCVPAMAATDGFSDQPLPVVGNNSSPDSSFFDSCFYLGYRTASNGNNYDIAVGSISDNSIFCFSLNSTSIVFCSSNSYTGTDYAFCLYQRGPTGSTSRISSLGIADSSFYDSYSLYYNNYSNSTYSVLSDLNIPVFSSLDEGLAAVRDYIDNGSGSTDSLRETYFSLPAGNIAFVDISGDEFNQASFRTTINQASWSLNNNQAWGYVDSIPSSFTVPFSGTSAIDWTHEGSADVFGQYSNWASLHSVNDTNGRYLVVVNPMYPQGTPGQGSEGALNGAIWVRVNQARGFKIISLASLWNQGEITADSSDVTYTGQWDEDTQTWITIDDSTGLPGTPATGGITSGLGSWGTVTDWLENIAGQIGGFFTGAIGAVTTLVSSASEFVSHFGDLYTWLPGSVYSVLVSGIILAITIGVIKVFI